MQVQVQKWPLITRFIRLSLASHEKKSENNRNLNFFFNDKEWINWRIIFARVQMFFLVLDNGNDIFKRPVLLVVWWRHCTECYRSIVEIASWNADEHLICILSVSELNRIVRKKKLLIESDDGHCSTGNKPRDVWGNVAFVSIFFIEFVEKKKITSTFNDIGLYRRSLIRSAQYFR